MGLFGRRRRPGVRGTAQVVSTSRAPGAAFYGRLVMDLVVEAPGIPAYAHAYRKLIARVAKWPAPGDVLPVEVDPTDLGRVDVLWDEVPTRDDAARRQAQRIAAARRQHGHAGADAASQPAGVFDPEVATIVDGLQQAFPDGVIRVNGAPVGSPGSDARVGPETPGGWVAAGPTGVDPIVRLEKLVRLRDAGVVNESQFARLRAQILEQSGLDP
jgi:hypothetical protein